jgi:RecA/RadA recombinase
VYYLSMRSSSKFVDRLSQMVQARGCDPSVLRKIMIREVSNMESLIELLQDLLHPTTRTGGTIHPSAQDGPGPSVPKEHGPRLLVLDSVADLFRGDSPAPRGEGWSAYATLRRAARMLRAYSDRHGVAVVCVNQVSTNVATGELKPALGLTWAQEMDRSYMVSRSTAPPAAAAHANSAADRSTTNLRTIELRQSSEFGVHRAHFTIQAAGVHHMVVP